MRALTLLFTFTILGCGESGPSQKDFRALEKRVAALEKRADAKHGDGKKGDGKHADGKKRDGRKGDGKHADGRKGDGKRGEAKAGDAGGGADAPKAKRGRVELEGDATKVQLRRQRARVDVPGLVPEGRYTVLATFGDDEVEAGQIEVLAAKTITVVCRAELKKCRTK